MIYCLMQNERYKFEIASDKLAADPRGHTQTFSSANGGRGKGYALQTITGRIVLLQLWGA